MIDKSQRNILGRFRELILRWFYAFKYLVKSWIRIPRDAPFWMKGMLLTIYIFAFFLTFLLAVDVNLFWLFGGSPKIKEIKNPEINLTSEIYSADEKMLGTLFVENRTPVEYKDLPQNLVDALIATEDVRFYQHHGIDLKATFAAVWSTMQGDKRGGSTITQQLVKNLFKTRADYSTGLLGYVPGVSTLISKTKEWINALKIELYYSKEEILTMYLNTVDFGSHAFGINSAASTFFNCATIQLNTQQSALLVGVLKAPSYYSPVSRPENALNRRNQVLQQMVKYGYISGSAGDSLQSFPLELKYRRKGKASGDASYLREAIARSLQKWSKETGHDIWTEGLKIYTTIDSRLQKYAEEAVAEHIKRLQQIFNSSSGNVVVPWKDEKGVELPGYFIKLASDIPGYSSFIKKNGAESDTVKQFLNSKRKMKVFTWNGERDTVLSVLDSLKHYKRYFQSGFVAIDPLNGNVKAWVGGINHNYFKYDHVNQSKRQPGSLFKAFVYSAAFDNGFGPCDEMTDQPVSIKYMEKGVEKVWEPHNVDRSHSGSMTLKHAFARSVNSIAVQLSQKIGWQKVIQYAQMMGIRSHLDSVPAVCLGSSDVNLLEIVNAYCTFVNGGFTGDPVLVTKIVDKNGTVIYEQDAKRNKVLSDETAFLMSVLLRSGLTEPGGTPQGLFEYDLFRFNTDFGGKTGTSSDYTDGWFIGVTPGLVGGCWVGNDDRSIHFKSSHIGEGLRTALPVYGKFMEKVLKDESLKQYRQKFPKPSVKIDRNYSCHTVLPKADSLELVSDSTALE
ncbi:MAG: transglycosylase domain-containing protein [Bacteroidales bacterium]|nr:transglycosylase domain-containing protein [Bacteroidales bacterium]